ncbi:uncharacterized protein [Hetaerina americana]|uniref:uncharacterized protein n=1 Tax=Hetaerina americana TaxID=62018 RepID=UPI003A7F40F2
MKRNNLAFKGWKSCMDGFTSEDTMKQETNLQFTPECDSTVEILWSSSSDEESAKVKSKRKKVVTRLNFDECISHASGPATPLYSRHLEKVETVVTENTCQKSLGQEVYDSFGSPKKENLMLPADVNLPSSPVIMRRKRRRSLYDAPVSPVIERKFMKKIRKVSPGPVNSPSNFVRHRLENKLALDSSICSSGDMMTPFKEDETFQTTSITPDLENMNLNSLKQKPKITSPIERKLSILATTPPIIEAVSSQDILENTGSDDLFKIKESNDSQAHMQMGLEIDSLPLSAVITMSASPSIPADGEQESGVGNVDPSFAMLPLPAETPHKNAFDSVEDPESGRKRKRLKKQGWPCYALAEAPQSRAVMAENVAT